MVRAAVIPVPGAPVEIREYPDPVLEPGAVLLRTLAAEVCGTDVHLAHGRLAGVPYPLIPGHVSAGEVIETGGEVCDIDGRPFARGDLVTFLDVHGTCGACWFCLVARASTRCPNRKVYGITYGADEGLLGGWSEKIYLKPGVRVMRLVPGVSPDLWISGGCSMPTAVHAVELAGIRLCDQVLVLGAGPVGLSVCALALASGAAWVGVVDPVESRRSTAAMMGADATLEPGATLAARVRDATGGRGADVVVEASGHPDAVVQALHSIRDAGRVVIVGQYTDNGSVSINPHLDINRKHVEVRGCWGSDYGHMWRAMAAMARFGGRFPWGRLVSRRYSLDQAGEALADVEARRVVKAVIVP